MTLYVSRMPLCFNDFEKISRELLETYCIRGLNSVCFEELFLNSKTMIFGGEPVESDEELVKSADEFVGLTLRGELGESDNVRVDYRHIVVTLDIDFVKLLVWKFGVEIALHLDGDVTRKDG